MDYARVESLVDRCIQYSIDYHGGQPDPTAMAWHGMAWHFAEANKARLDMQSSAIEVSK